MQIAVRRSLALAIAAGIALASTVQAGTLGPGQSATVNPGDAPESWSLNGAQLTGNPGARLLGINAGAASSVTADSVSIDGRINLMDSSLSLSSSTVQNTAGRALSWSPPVALPAARLQSSNVAHWWVPVSVEVPHRAPI
ncbi:TPA: hypothetical protein UM524_002494 [Stenotrophomonas maltophilia]|nr:hypothetical protein [Stenotrophomonas maltophilia]